ncbi:MAG: type 2 isopentenyl-diphosphate Delta-isomerase [Candidatus Aenigmatarchaeota archaeon]
MGTQKRKADHIRICLTKDVEFLKGNGFERYSFMHSALPEIDWDEIDTGTKFLGKKFRYPLFIEAMTGGTNEAERINKNLAAAAEELGIGMGVGSQRAMIEDPRLVRTYKVRDVAPGIFLAGNIGASHVLKYPPEVISKALEEIGADALAIHLNPAQEIVQDGGHTKWNGMLPAIRALSSGVHVPVIVKEVGSGISAQVAEKFSRCGISAIDTAGAGGTSWVKVDAMVGGKPFDEFFEWGIPTAESLVQCRKAVKLPLIASGGIRSGIDAAKAISLGASLAGMALPLLKPATVSSAAVKTFLEQVVLELQAAMFLTSSRNLQELKGKALLRF